LISHKLTIPTIGIGAGAGCDGQVLVSHDLLGIFDRFTPRFVKKYANVHGEMLRAFTEYKNEVLSHHFPTHEHAYSMPEEEWEELLIEVGGQMLEVGV